MARMHQLDMVKIRDVLVVRPVSRRLFDSQLILEFQAELLALLDEHQPLKMVVDFENVTQCSTSVINALLLAKKRLVTRGGDLRLCSLEPVLREAYQLLNLDGTVFQIYASEAEAIASFPAHTPLSGI